MKVFMVEKISEEVASFGAMPREAWMALGILELLCVAGLLVGAVIPRRSALTVAAAAVLALENLVFVWVHVQYREIPSIIVSGVLDLLMVFIAYGRLFLKPIV